MGAFFTSLLKGSSAIREPIADFFNQFAILRAVSSWRIQWPPTVETVRKSIPYLAAGLFLPKLLYDVAMVVKVPPIDEEFEKEETIRLRAAIKSTDQLLSAFLKSSPIRVPPKFEGLRDDVRTEISAYFDRYPSGDADSLPCKLDFVEDIIPGLAEGTLSFDDPTELQPGTDIELLGAPVASSSSVEENLNTLLSNLKVASRKISVPENPQHALHKQALEAKIILTLVQDIYLQIQNSFSIQKTRYFMEWSDQQVAKSKRSGEAKRWKTGKPLAQVWGERPRFMWWNIVYPYAMPRGSVVKEHWAQYDRSTPSSYFWPKVPPSLQQASIRNLVLLQKSFVENENLVKIVQRSKMKKILEFVRVIVGGPWNWSMVIAHWLLKFVEGVINGAKFYYRSLLIITAQKFATKVWPSCPLLLTNLLSMF